MITRAKFWSAVVLGCVACLALAMPILQRSFALIAVSDIVQALLLLSGAVVFVPRALRAHGRLRLFWALMAAGVGFWCLYQLLWVYLEVILRQPVPDLFWGDIVLFLHFVPLIAAIALRPHVSPDEYAARVGRLDFALLLVWWIYIYVFLVMSWQYAVIDNDAYARNLNAVYLIEKIVFLVALATCWYQSRRSWRFFYANLFGATVMYSAGSYLANWAIANRSYYTGSFYDIPLALSMAWVTIIGLWTNAEEPETRVRQISTAYGVWIARLGMIAVYSLPLFAAWAMLDSHVPAPVRSFRVLVTLMAALAMGVMVFVRQRLLDRELMRLLQQSQESVDNLRRLQTQVLQQEKLASIGQLVGGAAHELNNPITAMLGYSDLLLNTELTSSQKALAARIGQHVRRTRSLVASLLSFARKSPGSRALIDLNTILRTALKLTESQSQALRITIRTELDGALPKVSGDSNQLLQMCVQLLSTLMQVTSENEGRTLNASTRAEGGRVILQISHAEECAPAAATSSDHLPPARQAESLGLTACLGIVQEHQGEIFSQTLADGGSAVRVYLPIANNHEKQSISEAAAQVVLRTQSSS